mgnify:CR=1 FL=1
MIPLAIITKVKEISGADPNVVTIVWRGQVFKATLMAGVAVADGTGVAEPCGATDGLFCPNCWL